MLEALLFAKSKIAFLASDKLDEKNIYWFRLWYTKSVQLYQKANILLTGDSIANTAYEDIVASKKTFDKKYAIELFLAQRLYLFSSEFFFSLEFLSDANIHGPMVKATTTTGGLKELFILKAWKCVFPFDCRSSS